MHRRAALVGILLFLLSLVASAAGEGPNGNPPLSLASPPKQALPLALLENNRPYRNTSGSVVATYFAEWGVWERDYQVADLPASNLTHVLYAFLGLCGTNATLFHESPLGWLALQNECRGKRNSEVIFSDRYAALENPYPGDAENDPLKGNIGQLIRLKLAKPNLKILASIGGWLGSDPFFTIANDPAERKVFVNSVIRFLKTYPVFDGVDIDWEYPGGGANAYLGSASDYDGYAELVASLRTALRKLGQQTHRHYQLTAAAGAGTDKIAAANHAKAAQYLDYVFAMTYDYYGAWNSTLGHHTALFAARHAKQPLADSASTIRQLLAAGVPAKKLVLGVAMYGRGWDKVVGVADGKSPFLHGKGLKPHPARWERGLLDYREISTSYLKGKQGQNGYAYHYDQQAQAPYLWNAGSKRLISFEDSRSARAKGQFALQHQLGGLFSWEIDADNGDILNSMHEGLGHPGLHTAPP